MKFKIEVEIEIFDDELLEILNSNREDNDLELYDSLDNASDSEILKILSDTGWITEEITEYGFDIINTTIIK